MDKPVRTPKQLARDASWEHRFLKYNFSPEMTLKEIFEWGFHWGSTYQWSEQCQKRSLAVRKAWVTRRQKT
jgi:hypothetical protein